PGPVSVLGVVAQVRAEPAFGLAERPALATGVVGNLVAADAADGEVLRLRMSQVPARHRGRGPHREALGEADARVGFGVEQAPEGRFLGVVGAGGVAGGWADAAVALLDQVLVAEP